MGIYEKLKKALGNKWEDFLDFYATTSRNDPTIKAEWREACNVERDEDIDYSNPIVLISWELCDLRNMRLIYKGRHREEFLNRLPEGAREFYFIPMEDGGSFLDLEKPKVFKTLMGNFKKTMWKAVKKLRKEGKIDNKDLRRIREEAEKINMDEDTLTDEDDED